MTTQIELQKELTKALLDNPEHELLVMSENDASTDEYRYQLLNLQKVEVTKTIELHGRIFLLDEEEELHDTIWENASIELYPNKEIHEEQMKEIDKVANEEISKLEWKPSIVLYIGD